MSSNDASDAVKNSDAAHTSSLAAAVTTTSTTQRHGHIERSTFAIDRECDQSCRHRHGGTQPLDAHGHAAMEDVRAAVPNDGPTERAQARRYVPERALRESLGSWRSLASDVFRDLAQREGAFWMWSGASQLIARTALPMGLRLGCFQVLRSAFPVAHAGALDGDARVPHSVVIPRTIGVRSSWFPIDSVVSAVGAASVAIAIESPLTQARLHANAQQAFEFNFWPLARRLVHERGIASLFEGISYRLWYGIPFYGIMLPVYEWLVRVRVRDVSRAAATTSTDTTEPVTTSAHSTTDGGGGGDDSEDTMPDATSNDTEDLALEHRDSVAESNQAPAPSSTSTQLTSKPAPQGVSFTGMFFAGGLASVAATMVTMPIKNAQYGASLAQRAAHRAASLTRLQRSIDRHCRIRMNFHKVPARRTLIYMAQLSRQQFASFNFFSVRRSWARRI